MAKISRFKRIPLNVAGGMNETRSRAVSVSRLANWYPIATPEGVSSATLMPFPAITQIGTIYNDEQQYEDRGMTVFNGLTYMVKGPYLYRLNADFTTTKIGAIAGTSFCSFANNGLVLVICNGSTPYQYDGTTLSLLSAITFNPQQVTYNSTFFIFDSDAQDFWVSDTFSTAVQGDSRSVPQSSPDRLTVPYSFNQILYLISPDSVEPWVPAAAIPPFELAVNGIIEKTGCSAKHGVTSTNEAVYFIHKSGTAYRMKGFTAQAFAPSGIVWQLQSLDLENYRARSLSFDGQQFVIFDFYNDNKTWCYSETTDTWLQLDSGEFNRWQAGSNCFNYGLNIFTDNVKGLVYKLDFYNFVNNWGMIIREKTFDYVSGEKLGEPRGRLEMSRVVFGVEAGMGLISGQGEEPKLGVQFSADGKAWSQEIFLDLGRNGEYSKQVECSYMVQFQQLAIRTRLYDPIGFAFFSAAIDVREAGY